MANQQRGILDNGWQVKGLMTFGDHRKTGTETLQCKARFEGSVKSQQII